MSPLKIPQVTLPCPEHPADLEKFIHGSDVPSTLDDAFDMARRALEATNSFNEVKDIRDQAETLRAHARRVKWSLEIQNQCAEIKLRAERKAGSMLATLTIRGGERYTSHDGRCERYSILQDLDISWNQSSRWQTISRIPNEAFEDFLHTARLSDTELTQAAALRLATRLANRESPPDEDQEARQHAESLMRTLSALDRDLDRVVEKGWRFASKEAVRTRLDKLLSFCE